MTAAPGPQQPGEECERDAITDSKLASEPGPWSLIVDCTVHGEIARVPAGGADEMARVEAAWSQHCSAAPGPQQPDEVRCCPNPNWHAAFGTCEPESVQETREWAERELLAAPSAQPDKLHAPGPGSSLTGYLPQCWCQEKDDIWPCPSAQPDRVAGQGAAR